MLLFKPRHVAPILSDRKTETRRLWRSWRANVGSIQKAKTMMLSKDYFALLEILERWEERLGDISAQSVYNEGYDSQEEYFASLAEINARALKKITIPLEDLRIKVLKFRRVVG
jgi:hypothetical protein